MAREVNNLQKVLYDDTNKVIDIRVTKGSNQLSADEGAKVLLESMERMGITVEGKISKAP